MSLRINGEKLGFGDRMTSLAFIVISSSPPILLQDIEDTDIQALIDMGRV